MGSSLCILLVPSDFGGRAEAEVSMGCFLPGCTGSHLLDGRGVWLESEGLDLMPGVSQGLSQVPCWSSHCLGAEPEPQQLEREP